MLRGCFRGIAAACLMAALCLPSLAQQGASTAGPLTGSQLVPLVAADRPMTAGRSSYAMPNTHIDWSRRYELTPLEMKRLRAMGLRDKEIFVVANASNLTGMSVDELAQRIFRGQTTEMIAQDLNVSASSLTEVKPMWQTPEWEQAVREGMWYVPGPGSRAGGQGRRNTPMNERMTTPAPRRQTAPANRGNTNSGRRNRGNTGSTPDMTR